MIMHSTPPSADAVVAVSGRSARSRLQSADVIVATSTGLTDGLRWAIATLADYPGCGIAATRRADGRWCLLAVRDIGTLYAETDHAPLDDAALIALARACHAETVTSSQPQFATLRTASAVPVRITFTAPLWVHTMRGEDR